MAYGVEILPLEKLIDHLDGLKDISVERCIAAPKDEFLQYYRDYQFSLHYYLKQLEDATNNFKI